MNWFFLRKLIHLSAIFILFLYTILEKWLILLLLGLTMILYSISEILRAKKKWFPIIQKITLACSTKEEQKSFVAKPLYFALGIFLILLLFPKTPFYLGSIALVLGDAFARIVGERFGRIKIFYNKEKTLEGSLACLLTTFLGSVILVDFSRAILISIVATFIESTQTKYENLVLPLTVSFVAWLIFS